MKVDIMVDMVLIVKPILILRIYDLAHPGCFRGLRHGQVQMDTDGNGRGNSAVPGWAGADPAALHRLLEGDGCGYAVSAGLMNQSVVAHNGAVKHFGVDIKVCLGRGFMIEAGTALFHDSGYLPVA